MRERIRELRRSEFVRHNGIFFAGSLAVSALNYLYYPILGRLMPTAQFGEVQALVSVFLQATIFFTVVTNVAVNVVTNERDEARRNRIVYELEYVAALVTLAALAVGLVFAGQLRAYLQFGDVAPFFALAAALVLGVPLALRTAYLRGRSAFGAVSVASVLASLIKLAFSAGLVLLGWGTLGAMGGIVAAQVVAVWYAAVRARRLGLWSDARQLRLRRPDWAVIRPYLRYSALVLVISLVITTLFSFDAVVAKHFFTAEVAGRYAGVATVARIIYFLTGSIAAVLLSAVKLEAPAAVNRRLLWRSAGLQLLIGGPVLLVFALAPRWVVGLLIGGRYLAYAPLLPPLALALFVLATVSLVFYYDMALRRASAAVVAVLGAGVMVIFVNASHATPAALVHSLLLGAIVLLGLRLADSGRRWVGRMMAKQ